MPQSPGFGTRSPSGRRLGFPPKSSACEQEDCSRSDEERDFHVDSEIPEGLPKYEERVVEGDDEFNDTAPDDQTGYASCEKQAPSRDRPRPSSARDEKRTPGDQEGEVDEWVGPRIRTADRRRGAERLDLQEESTGCRRNRRKSGSRRRCKRRKAIRSEVLPSTCRNLYPFKSAKLLRRGIT